MRKRSLLQSKTLLLTLVSAIIAILLFQNFYPKVKDKIEINQVEKQNLETISKISEQDLVSRDQAPQLTLEKAYLEVDFICQAPLQTEENWKLHEESCEEAALLMAYLYETDQHMTKEEANQEILKMIAWQKENFGGHFDLYADQMNDFAVRYLGINEQSVQIIYEASIEDLKEQVSLGHPVIVPITGEILENPYYPYPGYHMLIVTGYTEDRIITNDNGTRRGEDFSYDIEVFEAAMKDAGADILVLEISTD